MKFILNKTLLTVIGMQLLLIISGNTLIFFVLHIAYGYPIRNCCVPLMILYTSFLGIFSYYTCSEIARLIQREKIAEKERSELEYLRSFNIILREQRHDVNNHFQVMQGLLQIKKYKLAEEYIREVAGHYKHRGRRLDNENIPENVEIMLISKMAYAQDKDISFEIDFRTNLSEYSISLVDITKIISNLLKNAFTAAENSHDKKYVLLSVWEDGELFLSVYNTGPTIPEEITDKIFNAGFTTKGDKGDGMGLYIVKKLCRKYKGNIELLYSDERGTKFLVRFPKSLKKNNPRA